MPPYAVMWSGGKDSALALTRARARGLEVGTLLNFIDAASGRVRFHATRAKLIAAQAAGVGVPLRQYPTTWEDFPDAFAGALETLIREGYAGVIFGDIHLADVRAWYEQRVRGAGLEHVEPLWGEAPAALLREFVAGGGRAVVTCCEVAKLDDRWLGRIIDERFVDEIAATCIDPCGENGEYHSFSFAGPIFRTPVEWVGGEVRLQNGFAQLDLLSPLDAVVGQVVADRPALARDVRARTPKAWGKLAALGVVAYRRHIGHPLSDAERRTVWSALWRATHEAVR